MSELRVQDLTHPMADDFGGKAAGLVRVDGEAERMVRVVRVAEDAP